MLRVVGIVGAGFVVFQMACSGALAAPASDPEEPSPIPLHAIPPHQIPPHLTPHRHSIRHSALTVAIHSRHAHQAQQAAAEDEPPMLTALPPGTLSAQEQSVGEIAEQNGDRQFLMVDKGLGKIVLFEDDKPVYIGNALTGESTADRLPPKEIAEKFDNLNALEDKVTPAGRFTVTRGYDPAYGPLFDVREIKGKDWSIAIHQVYLGIPSEHRDIRLQSPREDDKNITFGCINVSRETIQLLLRELPKEGPTALYVLPRDQTATMAIFAAHNS
jgi:L,D-transpeptidase catalytic domain